MRKTILLFAGVTLLSFSSFSQKAAEEAGKMLTNCECNEIIMIAGAEEKKYTGPWLEGVEYENGYVVFKKGASRHSWNADKIVFIQKEAGYIRVFLDQVK